MDEYSSHAIIGQVSGGGGFHQLQSGRSLLERDSGLLQNPRFNLDVPLTQQVERAAAVMLLSDGTWLVSHDLRAYTSRAFNPFSQRAKGTAQAMQRQCRKPGSGQSLVIPNVS